MDERDWPLIILGSAIGDSLDGHYELDVVTPEVHAGAVEYFRQRELDRARVSARMAADGPTESGTTPLTLYHGRQDHPGTEVLQNAYPARITIDGRSYPSVTHAYWALSTDDPDWRERITSAPDVREVVEFAQQAPRRPGWPAARLAIMTGLLRAKFAQHPAMARTLLATGDARIIYTGLESAYWTSRGQRGTNWIGRLLEVVRSELAAAEAGIPVPAMYVVTTAARPAPPVPAS